MWHFPGVTRSRQNRVMPATNSSFVVGLTIVRRKCLSSCHRSSIGLRSGLSGGLPPVDTFPLHKLLRQPARVLWVIILLETMAIGKLFTNEGKQCSLQNMLRIKLSIHVAGEYQDFSGSPLRNPCPDMKLVWVFGAALHLRWFPLVPKWQLRMVFHVHRTLIGKDDVVETLSVLKTLHGELKSPHSVWLTDQLAVLCSRLYPAHFFVNAFDLTLRKVAKQLFIDLLAKMGRSKLVIFLHCGIYEV